MNTNSGEKWAAMAGSLAGAVDVAIVHLETSRNGASRALECLRDVQARWDRFLDIQLGPKQEDISLSDIDAELAEFP